MRGFNQNVPIYGGQTTVIDSAMSATSTTIGLQKKAMFRRGDYIIIEGTGKWDGVYQVRDTMNPKWVNVVDILESKHVEPYKYENVHIYKMNWTDNLTLLKNNNS